MDDFSTIRDVIDLWPTRAAVAVDMNNHLPEEGPRVTGEQVHKWAQKCAIPARFHRALISAAQGRGFTVSADDVVRLHDPAVRAVA
ncbi:hypothetical protein ACFSZS_12305 [Seohaeicola zhoushanensis]